MTGGQIGSWRAAFALAFAAGLIQSAVPAAAQQQGERTFTPGTPAEVPLRTKVIAPGFVMITGRGGNSLAARSDSGVVLVDAKLMYRAIYDDMLGAIDRSLNSGPPVLAFLTHHHADHSGGGEYYLGGGARLVGHESLVPILQSYVSRIAPRNPTLPTETFASLFSEDLGGLRIEAYHWGPAHTQADIAVYFPQQRIVAAGDLVYGSGELAVDYVDGNGSIFGMLDRLNDLLALDFQILVSGHGDNVMTREEVVIYRDRLARLINRGLQAVRDGAGVDDLRSAMRSDDLGFRLVGHFWTESRFLAPLHAELLARSRSQER